MSEQSEICEPAITSRRRPVLLLSGLYYLTDAKSKYITMGADATQQFAVIVQLCRSGSGDEVSLPPERYMKLMETFGRAITCHLTAGDLAANNQHPAGGVPLRDHGPGEHAGDGGNNCGNVTYCSQQDGVQGVCASSNEQTFDLADNVLLVLSTIYGRPAIMLSQKTGDPYPSKVYLMLTSWERLVKLHGCVTATIEAR